MLTRVKLSDLTEPYFNYNLLYSLGTATIINIILLFQSNDKLVEVLQRCRCLINDTYFIDATKTLNNYTKTHSSDIKDKQKWSELQVLVGYRTQPFPGFDEEQEAKNLAEGGTNEIPEEVFEKAVSYLFSLCSPNPKFEDLRSYIEKQTWSTTGSSSFGKVEGIYEGENFKYKARKNDIQHLFSTDELMDMLENWDGIQLNQAAVKEETGKLRLFVAGDTISYLYASWLNSIVGSYWKQLPFNWDDSDVESLRDELTMLKSMLINRFSAPFDFEQFDHQPKLFQVTIIIIIFLRHGGITPPEKFIKSYFLAFIISRAGNRYRITGGVPSGNYFTSLVGNIFNMACQLIISTCTNVAPRYVKCRGDDSLLIFDSEIEGINHLVSAAMIGINMGKGKFSLQYAQTEFLRVWHTIEESGGYLARSIVSMTQRKPWSSDPHETFSLILSQIESNVTNLLRGGSDYMYLIKSIFTKQFGNLNIIKGLIGSGLPSISYDYDIDYKFKQPTLPILSERQDSIANTNPTIPQLILLDNAKYNLDHYTSTLVLPYVPGIYGNLKRNAISSLKNATYKKIELEKFNIDTFPFSINKIIPYYENSFNLVDKLSRYSLNKLSFNKVCKQVDPILYYNLRSYNRRNFTRQAAMWNLSQMLPVPTNMIVPSTLKSSVSRWLFQVSRRSGVNVRNNYICSCFVKQTVPLLYKDKNFSFYVKQFTC